MQFPKQNHLYIYNRNHQRQTENQVPFYFFGSGSSGNSVYLKQSHLLIDLGFPYKKYQTVSKFFFYDVRYILLTHEHSDHLNTATLFHLLKMYPHLRFIISQRMFDRLTSPMYIKNFTKNINNRNQQKNELATKYRNHFLIFKPEQTSIEIYQNDFAYQPVTINPHMVSHGNIENVAYEIKTNQHHILYSSDLDHVFAPENNQHSLPLNYDVNHQVTFFKHPFDIIFLEANYDRDILKRFLGEHPEDAHANGNLRHISEQETWQYIKYSLAENGIFIPLHASSQFGTLIQDLS